ncbi:MAG: LysM-like peptidoglycan-binding domain-containing protein [Moritella sp.]|uniref:LysM-like peptidoglycan-binding domain-containing protein n=1 Tax=Moritella sp. TaxID=78556 RepID=UPI0029A22F1E|nr:LysM-like peptidoglycan-binding domain-containing protein [Moritella sp.]MDX2321823.1 LysM-like peptidoglycan-binding domain-containing protein [Moritella sp.]
MASNALYSLIEKTKLLFPSLTKHVKALRHAFKSLPSLHRKLLPILSLIIIVLMIMPSTDESNSNKHVSGERKSIALTIAPTQNVANKAGLEQGPNSSTPAAVQIKVLDPENIDGQWNAHVIRKGDSVYRIFRQYDIPSAVLHDLIAIRTPEQYITQVKPGQIMSFYISTAGKLIQLRITDVDNTPVLFSLREDGSYIYQ